MRYPPRVPLAALALTLAGPAAAQPFHTPGFIDDFESYTLGEPAGQGLWFSVGNVNFASNPGVDPGFGLQSLAVGVSASNDRAVKILSDEPAYGRINLELFLPDTGLGLVELIEGDSNRVVASLYFDIGGSSNPIETLARGSTFPVQTGAEWIPGETNRIGIEVLPGDIVNYYHNDKLIFTGEDLSEFGSGSIGFDEFEFTNDRFLAGTFYLDNFDFPATGPTPCSPADLAEPFGELNFNDVVAFLSAFAAMDPAADIAAPAEVFDFNDVLSYLTRFAAGCP